MSYSIPPPEHPHTWAELLTLVRAVRRIAYDITLEAGDALRRDLFAEFDEGARHDRTPRRLAASHLTVGAVVRRYRAPVLEGTTFPIR